MIRDPSDGSVREPTKSAPEVATPQNSAERLPSSDAADSGADTGLPSLAGEKSSQLARLNRSREWLRDYHQRKSVPPTKTEEP